MKRICFSLVLALTAGWLIACGGGSTETPPPQVSISISPTSASVETGATQQFTASVTGSSNTAVTWQVNGAVGGSSSAGTITMSGLYTAPAVAPSSSVVSVAAIPQADPSKVASASVSIVASVNVSLSPTSATVAAAGQQQFTATVANTSNKTVHWQVNGTPGGTPDIGTVSSSGLYVAPGVAMTATVSAEAAADTSKSASANISVLAPHRIGVRPTSAGLAEFYDRTTNQLFTPRGNNYIRLGDGHSTFNVGVYDAERAEAAFITMQTNGYNTVRVFTNPGHIGNPAGGLDSSYIANLVDFLERARDHNLYVIIEFDFPPDQGGYTDLAVGCTDFGYWNGLTLCAGGVASLTKFAQDFVQDLVNMSAPLDAIFAIEVRNEEFYDSDQPPLSWTSGTIATANGQTYDMSDAASRQQMMDDGLVYLVNHLRAAILVLDPTALVEIGFFVPWGPNPTRIGDARVTNPYPAIAGSTIDFVSVHTAIYRGNLTLDQYMQNFGFVGYQKEKPVIMEEFAALGSDYTEAEAASLLQAWQMGFCNYGITGSLLWTWDTSSSEQPQYWWAAILGEGLVNQALAPVNRPDPCK